MEYLKTIVVCKKDLFDLDGKMFTKGQIYEGRICNVLENLTVINDNGEPHKLGNWSKHFVKKPIKY